jgi:hypothetical protein
MNKSDNTATNQIYGHRPMWQWILIYAIVGGAIYGALYLFLNKPAHGYNYQTKTSAQAVQPAPAATQAPAAPNSAQPANMPAASSAGW